MAVRRIGNTIYSSDKNQSMNTAKIQMQFIEENISALSKLRNADKIKTDYRDIKNSLISTGFLSDGQKSYIDGIYEKVMKALDYGGFSPTFKPKKSLRY